MRFLWRHHGVRSNSVIGALQSVAGAGFMALAVPWCDRVLRVGTSGWRFGLVFSAWGVGGIIAAWLTPRLLRRFTAARLTLGWIPVSAAFGLLVALSTHWVAAVLFMIGVGHRLPAGDHQLAQLPAAGHAGAPASRVNTAGRMLSWGLGWTIGALLAGALADQVGVRPAMLTVVGVGLVAAAYAWLSPLRQIALVDAAERAGTPPDRSPCHSSYAAWRVG